MRRGVHASYLVIGFILLAAVLLVSSVVFVAWKNVYEKTEQSSRCTTQIRSHAAAVRTTGELKAPEVVCPTERFVLEPDQDAERFLAKEMKRCWDMWGRGELQLFGADEGIYCHVCSTVRMDREPIEGFPLWLARNRIGRGQSYYEYFTGSTFGDDVSAADMEDMAKGTIPTDKPIGAVFYHVKSIDSFNKFKNNHLNPATGTAAGGVGGAGLMAIGLASIGTGVGVVPGLLVLGAGTTGATVGFFTGIVGRTDLSHVSSIVVRPLAEEDVRQLGCTYAPVANE